MTIQEIFALPNEVFATLIACITIAVITAAQIINLAQGKNAAAPTEASPSLAVFAQVVYGLLVCAGFTWWTFNLFAVELFNWAVVSGCFALVGLIMPIIVWQRATTSTLPHNEQPATAFQQSEAPIIAENEDSGLAHALDSLATLSESVTEIPTAPEYHPSIPQPELMATELVAESPTPVSLFVPNTIDAIVGTVPDRPTDATLKRHYDQLMSVSNIPLEATQAPILVQTSPSAPAEAVSASANSVTITINLPEDSILRRHTIGLMRAQIENKLPDRPSDSILKRHYNQLLASTLEKHQLL